MNRVKKSSAARYQHLSLRWRILSATGLLVVLTTLMAGLTIGLLIFQQDQKSWQEHQLDATTLGGKTIESFISEQWNDLESLAAVANDSELAVLLAENMVEPTDPLHEVVYIDNEGQIVFDAFRDNSLMADLFTASQSNWFQQTRAGERTISKVDFDAENTPYMIMALPGHQQGVIAARLRMDVLIDVLSEMQSDHTRQAYLVHENGDLQAHSSLDLVNSPTNLSQRPMWSELINGSDQVWQGAYTSSTYEKVVGTIAPIPATDWLLIAELPQLEAFRTTLKTVWLGLLGLAAAGIFSWFVTRYISEKLILHPLSELEEGANRFGRGQYDYAIELDTGDEFQSLAETFNLMAMQIQDRETALIAAGNKAREGMRFKSRLLANVSHELRTPLGGILGISEMLKYGLYGPVNEKQEQAAAKIIANTEFLSALVGDLLEQATAESGRMEIKNEPFSPYEVIGQLVSRMNVLAEKKGLYLNSDMDGQVPARLCGDQGRLLQVLINLVGNAIKFTERGGVTVRGYLPDDIHWAIEVTDTGTGIDPENQNIIFEPFRQVDNSLTRKFGGNGLGLSIAKDIVSSMKGTIRVESELDQGSTFTVVLPLNTVPKDIERDHATSQLISGNDRSVNRRHSETKVPARPL